MPKLEKLTKLCSNAGFSKNVEKGQFFITLDDDPLDKLMWSCREYTLPRSDESSQAKGRIRGNTKIGPVLDVKVCYHQGRYGVEIKIESLFRDSTVSCVRIVNGINKYVTETSEEIPVASVGSRSTGKLVAKGKPRQTSNLTMSPVSIPYRERKWIDIEPGKFTQGCFEVSKFMIRLLRHDGTVHREDDGAVRFDDLAELFKSRFAGNSHWSIEAWISFLAKGEGQKKRIQYCLNPNSSEHFVHFGAIQEHSGGTLVDPTFQNNVLLPDDFAEYIYHVGNAHDMHFIIQCGLIPGGKNLKRDRHSVFFTAVNPMYTCQHQEEVQYDLDKSRIAVHKNT